jgi:hypothetical protein
LTDIEDAKKRKMRLVVDKNRDAAQAAYWLDNSAPPQVKEQVIGPLIMHIDVPDKAHQPLIEEAIGPKHAFSGFLAMNDEVRNVVTRHVSEQSWKLNVYKNDGAGGYRPRQRPASSTMHKWGVTKWLDEALQIADQYRDAILTALKDLMQLDLFLLATPKTMGCIEQLQQCVCCAPVRPLRLTLLSDLWQVPQRAKDGDGDCAHAQPRLQGHALALRRENAQRDDGSAQGAARVVQQFERRAAKGGVAAGARPQASGAARAPGSADKAGC